MDVSNSQNRVGWLKPWKWKPLCPDTSWLPGPRSPYSELLPVTCKSHARHTQVSYCEFMPLSVPPLEFKPSVSELGRETVRSLMRSWMHYSIYLFKILDPPLVIWMLHQVERKGYVSLCQLTIGSRFKRVSMEPSRLVTSQWYCDKVHNVVVSQYHTNSSANSCIIALRHRTSPEI